MLYLFTALLIILVFVISASAICFFMTFYSPARKKKEEYPIPLGKIYEPLRESFVSWLKEMRALPCRQVSVRSHDGLVLRGKYFEYSPDAPIEILFHGYRGSAESDLSGGVIRCRKLGHSALIADHRACGDSDGHIITFGAKEKLDTLTWVDFVLKEINPNAKIILTGISMGAATVCLTSDRDLPENVVGILADCGYTCAKDIIKKVISDLHLPPFLIYPFVLLGARLFGGIDLKEASPIEAVKNSRVPIIFFHGTQDDFVPCEMSKKLYNACGAKKELVIIEGAGHGLSYTADSEKYLDALENFFEKRKNYV